MAASRPEPVLMTQNGAVDKWRRRIIVQSFGVAILGIFVVEAMLLLIVGVVGLGSLLVVGAVGLPILLLIVAFIEGKRMQARTLNVLTNYVYHWTYRPDELEAFSELFRRQKRKNRFGMTGFRSSYPHVRRNRIAAELYISRTHLYEIGRGLVPLRVPLSAYFLVLSDQLTILQHQYEQYDGEGGGTTFEIWILVPASEADQFKPKAK